MKILDFFCETLEKKNLFIEQEMEKKNAKYYICLKNLKFPPQVYIIH